MESQRRRKNAREIKNFLRYKKKSDRREQHKYKILYPLPKYLIKIDLLYPSNPVPTQSKDSAPVADMPVVSTSLETKSNPVPQSSTTNSAPPIKLDSAQVSSFLIKSLEWTKYSAENSLLSMDPAGKLAHLLAQGAHVPNWNRRMRKEFSRKGQELPS